MEAVTIIAAFAVVAAGLSLAFKAGRKHRQERHEVENFFSSDTDEPAWWEERR